MPQNRNSRYVASIAVAVLSVLPAVASAAPLQDVVFKVETQYHELMREQFLRWAEAMRGLGSAELETYFRAMADHGAGGTGWLFSDPSGRYVITNAHVVAGAAKVTLSRERGDAPGRMQGLGECEILYADSDSDLAVIGLPDSMDVPAVGLELATNPVHNLQQVVAAGFPGHLGPQTWNITRGEVSNSNAPGEPFRPLGLSLDSLIEHTAMIDHGNSGGPLLVARRGGQLDDRDSRRFVVVGVNTLNVGRAFFSIPAGRVRSVLERARSVRTAMRTAGGREESLRTQAKILEAELARVRTGRNDLIMGLVELRRFVSQAYVGRHGSQTFLEDLLQRPSAQRDKPLKELFQDPIAVLTRYAVVDFVRTLASVGDLSTTHFREINFADRQNILNRTEITTTFEIGSRKQDVVWTLEAGEWRIAELKFAPTSYTHDPPPRALPSDDDSRGRVDRSASPEPAEKPARKRSLMDQIRDG